MKKFYISSKTESSHCKDTIEIEANSAREAINKFEKTTGKLAYIINGRIVGHGIYGSAKKRHKFKQLMNTAARKIKGNNPYLIKIRSRQAVTDYIKKKSGMIFLSWNPQTITEYKRRCNYLGRCLDNLSLLRYCCESRFYKLITTVFLVKPIYTISVISASALYIW